MALLFPGARVFVNIPGTGYVGVGVVKERVVPVSEFLVVGNGSSVPLLQAPLRAPKMGEGASDLELCEHVVRIEWLKAVPSAEAYWEKGLFAIQHTACRLRNQFTLERLCKHFEVDA